MPLNTQWWLYSNSLYSFLNGVEYSKVREFLGDIEEQSIIWEWVNALIVKHPVDDTKIIKIWKPGKDDIKNEAKVHNEVSIALVQLYKDVDLKGSKRIKIPELILWSYENFFVMEKVGGQCFKTKFYIHLYSQVFYSLGYSQKELLEISDISMERLLQKHALQKLAHPNDTFLTPNELRLEKLYKEWWEKEYHWPKFEEMRNIMHLLQQRFWIEILDRNPWNFMETPTWEIYIIDFWLTK